QTSADRGRSRPTIRTARSRCARCAARYAACASGGCATVDSVRSARLLVVAAVLAAGARADAYDQKVHVLLSARGFAGDAPVSGDASGVALLRQPIWHAGAESKDTELRRRFLARWPAREAFDAWAMKQLFALNPDKHVAGFDDDVALPAGGDARTVYAA